MKHITFVRHGQSLSNIGGVTMAHHAIPLTDLGREQAEVLSTLLPPKPSAVYTSPFIRTRETARPYCSRVGQEAIVEEALHEFETIDPELLSGMNGEERRPIVDAYWQAADPGQRMGRRAETFGEFDSRVSAFVAQALDRLPNNAVVFGHGMWIAMLCWKLFGFSHTDSLAMRTFRRYQLGFPMPNGAVYHLRHGEGAAWRVEADENIMRRMVEMVQATGR